MIRRPPRSTLFPYTTALPISQHPAVGLHVPPPSHAGVRPVARAPGPADVLPESGAGNPAQGGRAGGAVAGSAHPRGVRGRADRGVGAALPQDAGLAYGHVIAVPLLSTGTALPCPY